MARFFFGGILALIGLLYVGAAWLALTAGGFVADAGTSIYGAILFLAVAGAAAWASVNLLREKRR